MPTPARSDSSFHSVLLKDGCRKCSVCGLVAKEGRHGMVDCVDEFRRQIDQLRQQRHDYRLRATLAEKKLAEIKYVLGR